jgi:hypothetical protein
MRVERLHGSDELCKASSKSAEKPDRVREDLFGIFLAAGVHPQLLNLTISSP